MNKTVDDALGAHAPAVVVAVVSVVVDVSESVVLLFVAVVTSAAVVSMSIGSTVVTVSLPAILVVTVACGVVVDKVVETTVLDCVEDEIGSTVELTGIITKVEVSLVVELLMLVELLLISLVDDEDVSILVVVSVAEVVVLI
jgi:hypothetical protein